MKSIKIFSKSQFSVLWWSGTLSSFGDWATLFASVALASHIGTTEGNSEITAVVGPKKMSAMLRLEFYERAKKAYAVIQTSERRFYSGFAIRKGVIGPSI